MLSSKCSAQPQISKKCSDLKFNFTFTNFQNRLLYIQPVKKTKKVPVKYNSYAWTKTKVRTPDGHFIEKINFQLHKNKHTPTRENFTILPIKRNDYCLWKKCKKLAWYFFWPVKKLDNSAESGFHGHFWFSGEKQHRSDLNKFQNSAQIILLR